MIPQQIWITLILTCYFNKNNNQKTSSQGPLLYGERKSYVDASSNTTILISSAIEMIFVYPLKNYFLQLFLTFILNTSFSKLLTWMSLGPCIGWKLLKKMYKTKQKKIVSFFLGIWISSIGIGCVQRFFISIVNPFSRFPFSETVFLYLLYF